MIVRNRKNSEDFYVQNRLNGQINLIHRFIWPEIKAQTNENIKWTKFDLTFQVLFDLECVKIFIFIHENLCLQVLHFCHVSKLDWTVQVTLFAFLLFEYII